MVSRHDMAGSRQGVSLVQHGIGRGDSQFEDGPGVNHITKIDDTGYRVAPALNRLHQHVVIVGIIVNNAGTQVRQLAFGSGLKTPEKITNQLAVLGSFDII